MRWRIVSGLFLVIWLALLAVEFCEDLGLLDYDDPGMDHSMNATLESLADAIQLDDHDHPLKTVFPALSLGIIDPYLHQSLPFHSLIHGPTLTKTSLKIFKFCHVFLI